MCMPSLAKRDVAPHCCWGSEAQHQTAPGPKGHSKIWLAIAESASRRDRLGYSDSCGRDVGIGRRPCDSVGETSAIVRRRSVFNLGCRRCIGSTSVSLACGQAFQCSGGWEHKSVSCFGCFRRCALHWLSSHCLAIVLEVYHRCPVVRGFCSGQMVACPFAPKGEGGGQSTFPIPMCVMLTSPRETPCESF